GKEYENGVTIREGGFGKVMLVTRVKDNKKYTLKEFKPSLGDIEKEIRVLVILKIHPFIQHLHGSDLTEYPILTHCTPWQCINLNGSGYKRSQEVLINTF
ncbi:unnamed protein product, partial [Owenia fusiformis]